MALILLKTGLRDAMRRPWLTGLLILSVALGVAVVVAIDMANESSLRAFNLSTEAVTGRATHQIVGGPSGIDESVYRELRVIHGYRFSAPVVDGYATAIELGGQTVRVLGVDPFAEAPFRAYFASMAGMSLESMAAFFTQPGAVLVSADSAARFGLSSGDSITLQAGSRRPLVVIVGLLRPPDDISGRALEGLMLADIATAQELLNMTGRLSRIDLVATAAAAETISAQLPPGLSLVGATEQAETVAQLTAAFQLNLTAFSLLALVVGMFLIYNTVTFSVVQRRQILGIMRALGVTGGQVFWLILAEAALLGTAGAILGLGLGVILGRSAVLLVTQTINDLYFSVTVRMVEVQPPTLLKGVLLGVGAAVLAAALPAAEAATVPPVAALQRSALEDRIRRAMPWLARVGLMLLAAGAAVIALVQSSVAASFAGLLIALGGVALSVPAITAAVMRAAAVTVGRRSLSARMAARTVAHALSRTSVAIAALTIAVSVVIGVSVMIASFRQTVETWLGQTLLADIYISPPQVAADRPAAMDPAIPDRVRDVAGVSAVETYRTVSVNSPDLGPVRLSAVTSARDRDATLYRDAAGNPADVWSRVEAGAVIVTEPFANRHHLPAGGGRVNLVTDRGPQTFPVAAVSYDYSSDRGLVIMSLDVYRRYWDDGDISSAAVYLAPGTDAEQAEDAVRAALGGSMVAVRSNRALREAALVIFDRTFAITVALRVVAVVVAFIGVLSALTALQLERTREFGTLRAAGMTLPQLWRLTLLETGLMGAVAGALAVPTGLGLAAVLIYVINLRSFGWTILFAPVPEVYAQALALSVCSALLAAVYPMQRLGRMEAASALRSE